MSGALQKVAWYTEAAEDDFKDGAVKLVAPCVRLPGSEALAQVVIGQ
jgi:hypothetical protein